MRYLIIACLALSPAVLASVSAEAAQAGAAQSTPQQQGTAASSQTQQEPKNNYEPCPANVVMADGSHECLGMPSYPSQAPTHRWRHVSWRHVSWRGVNCR
jgi:hypothetical protein